MQKTDLHLEKIITSYCRMSNEKVVVNGEQVEIQHFEEENASWLNDIYRTLQPSYSKFFKMDHLSKAGFLASELLLKDLVTDRETPKSDISIVLANRSSSLDDDTIYQKTIQDDENYFPSPSVFVYTLANIVTGEIAIRNKIMGETSFYISETFDIPMFYEIVEGCFSDKSINSVICGWVDYYQNSCDVLLMLVAREHVVKNELNRFTVNNINNLYNI